MKKRTKRFCKCVRAVHLEASFSGNCDIGGSGDISIPVIVIVVKVVLVLVVVILVSVILTTVVAAREPLANTLQRCGKFFHCPSSTPNLPERRLS